MSRLPRIGWSSVGLGMLAILTCELPLIIAFLGVGGVLAFDIPGWLEPAGIGVAAFGAGLLLYWRLRRGPALKMQAEEKS